MPREFHYDPRKMLLDAAESSGLLREIGEMLFFLNGHKDHVMSLERIFFHALVDALEDIRCPTPADLLNEYTTLDYPVLRDGETPAELEAFLAMFPLPENGWAVDDTSETFLTAKEAGL